MLDDVEKYWSRELKADVEIYEAQGLFSVRIDGIRLVESNSLQKAEEELSRYYMVREESE